LKKIYIEFRKFRFGGIPQKTSKTILKLFIGKKVGYRSGPKVIEIFSEHFKRKKRKERKWGGTAPAVPYII
jgi:hypothetical protein